MTALPRKCFQDRWFQFDFALVVVTFVGQIVASFSQAMSDAMQQVGQCDRELATVQCLKLPNAFRPF